MIALQQPLLFGFLLIPFSQGENIWKLEQSSKNSSEKQVPGKLLWTLSTPSGVSCAALCLQKSGCLFYGYQTHMCHGYLGSEERNSPVGMSAVFQRYFRRYFKNARMREQTIKHHKSKFLKEQTIKDPKTKAVDDEYRHLTSGSTHLDVKRHLTGRLRDEALKVCQAEDATLIKLDTQKKIRLFMKEFRNRSVHEQSFIIGLSDRYDNDTWYWTDGARLSGFSNWHYGEPDNTNEGKKENCVKIVLRRFFSGKWYDFPCQIARSFVCERV